MFDFFGAISNAVGSITNAIGSAVNQITKVIPAPKPSKPSTPPQAAPTTRYIREADTVKVVRRGSSSTSRRRSSSSSSSSRRSTSRSSFSFPKISLPKIAPPKVSLPSIPKIEPPKINIPPIKPTLPKVEPPKISLPPIKPIIPKFEVPKIQPIHIQPPKVEVPKIAPPKIQLPNVAATMPKLPPVQIKIPEPPKIQPIKVDQPITEAKSIVVNLIEKRDAAYERGNLPEVAAAMAADIVLPLDLAKVITKRADEPMDYVWAGVDVLGLIPIVGWGAKGMIKGAAKTLKAPVKALKILDPLKTVAKTSKVVGNVGDASKVVVKGVKGVDNLSWIKGLSRIGKFGSEIKLPKIGGEIKEIKTIRRVPAFRLPRVSVSRKIVPRKIPRFEIPKLKNPFARMRSIKVFKHVDEIPTVAKAVGKAATPKLPKVLKASKFEKAVKYGVPTLGALGVGYLMGKEDIGGGSSGAQIRYTVSDYAFEPYPEGFNYEIAYPEATYPEGSFWDWLFGGGQGADYPSGEPYPTGYDQLPPEVGYPESGYPAYLPPEFADYFAPVEGAAQDVLSAIEGVPVVGNLATEAKKHGFALPFLIVGAVGAYAAYKYAKPKFKKLGRGKK